MALADEALKIRAKQVGMLMRAYRESFPLGDDKVGLTLEELLARMAAVNQRYENTVGSTPSRWESGQTRPSRRRLQDFGIALNLSEDEIDGLIALAGLHPGVPPDLARASQEVAEATATADPEPETAAPERLTPLREQGASFGEREIQGETGVRPFLAETLQYVGTRFLLPTAAIAGAGYLLSTLGITHTWVLMLYLGVAMGLVVFVGFFRMRPASKLRDLLFVSLFFVLSTAVLQVPFLRMDNYGFYNLGPWSGIMMPMVLSLSANILIALVASLAFDYLWRWQYSGRGAGRAYQRALWVVTPPLGFVYLWVLLMANYGAWVGCTLVLATIGGVLAMLIVLRDESVRLTEWDRRFLLWCCLVITIVLSAISTALGVAAYLQPNLWGLTGHTLFHSWAMDFAVLGYPEEELVTRFRLGYAWNSLSCAMYLIIALGGSLTTTIYRLGGGDAAHPTADIGEVHAGQAAQPEALRERIKSLLGPGRLSGSPIRPAAA